MSSPADWLSALPLMSGVESGILRELASHGTLETVSAGTWLTREGASVEQLTLVLRGVVMSFVSRDGALGGANTLFAPTAVGLDSVLSRSRAALSARTLGRATVLRLPTDAFVRAIDASSALRTNLLRETARQLLETIDMTRALHFDDVESRLTKFLLRLADSIGLPGRDGTLLPIELTQDDLAEAIGAERRSIHRIVKAWKSQQLISKSEKKFTVDVDALRNGHAVGRLVVARARRKTADAHAFAA